MKRALAAAVVALAAGAAPAHAADSMTIAVKAKGVKLGKARSITLPVTTDTRALTAKGSLKLRAGRRSVTLGTPRLELGARPRVTARLGGRRSTVLTLAVAPVTTAQGVRLERTGVRLSGAAAKTIARRLRVKLPRGTFGTVAATGTFAVAPAPQAPIGPCTLSTAGGTPPAPGTAEPPVKARPAGARTITSAAFTWRVRDSFIRYIASGQGTTPSRGTAGAAPEGTPPLVYAYSFPFAEGWCDPASGTARLTFAGTVAFRYADHGIDLVVNDPEIELDGPASRVIFRMTGSGDTAGGNKRQVVETLDVSKATTSGGGNAFAYERIPGAVPPGAASSVFAGYYLPGDPFGWVSLSYTTE